VTGPARYESTCPECGARIHLGDPIRHDEDNDAWVHASCSSAGPGWRCASSGRPEPFDGASVRRNTSRLVSFLEAVDRGEMDVHDLPDDVQARLAQLQQELPGDDD
jgi:hypothetical protein